MNSITLGKRNYTAPSEWNDISEKQLLIWIRIKAKQITPERGFLLAAILFYNIPRWIFFRLNPVQQYQLSETLKFLWETKTFVKWVIPEIRIFFRKFIGPANRLSNCTIKEFRVLEIYYSAYVKSKDERYLDMLIATLYRPKGFNPSGDDERVKLTDISVRKNAKQMRRLSQAKRQAILFNYEGCRSFIFSRYIAVFKPGKGKGNEISDMEGLIKTIAGAKFGSFRETENTPLYLFLDHLRDEIEAYENRKS